MSNKDEYNRSSLHYVCVDLPIEERASVISELILNGDEVNAQDVNGWSPLHFAAQEGDLEVAKILLNAGATIDLKDSNGNSPLWVAAMNSHQSEKVITLLLNNDADPKQKNDHGISPYEIAPEVFHSIQ